MRCIYVPHVSFVEITTNSLQTDEMGKLAIRSQLLLLTCFYKLMFSCTPELYLVINVTY